MGKVDSTEIDEFLRDFKLKLGIWGIIFRDDRGKNFQTLLDLDLTTETRKKIVSELDNADYHKGPVKDNLNNGPNLWIFKKKVKSQEVYIKISLGACNNKVICISFHT